jgi:hypothetical protein
MTMRSSASTRSHRTTIIPVGGRAAPQGISYSTSQNGTNCRRTIRRSLARRPVWPLSRKPADMMLVTRVHSSVSLRPARNCARSHSR